MRRTRNQAAATLAAVALLCGSAPGLLAADAEAPQPWNQSKVTEIAKGLAKSADDLALAFRREPADMIPSADQRARYAVKQDLRRLKRETRQLAKELEAGHGHDETLDIFLNIKSITRAAASNGKSARLTQPTLDKIAVARQQLTELAPYYGETWKPLMNTP